MRNYIIAIALFCSATGSRSLPAGDNAAADGFAETLLRKLKVMPPAKCTCQDGFTLIDGTCTRSIETDPQEVCHIGSMVEGLCVMPAEAVMQCPEEYITACTKKDLAQSPCCAKSQTAEKIAHCRDGTEFHEGHCTRVLTHQPVVECPVGFGLSHEGLLCVKEEIGQPTPVCAPPDALSAEGDSCITTVEQGFEYVCPDEFECIASTHKKKKYSPLCSACARTTEAPPHCGCPEGQIAVEGFCYDAETYALCQNRRVPPRKQAPSKKQPVAYPSKDIPEPEIDCKPIGPIICDCDRPFSLECAGEVCRCLHREVLPVTPICRGQLDEGGNCIALAQKRPMYTCAEGFTCDVIDKKGQCRCTRMLTAEPTSRCLVGEPHGHKCIEVVKEEKIFDCPPGYIETCCEDRCTCTKTHLAMRQVKCEEGAVSIQGDCAFVSKPSAGCYEVTS
ncbi:oocyst wall protein COWP, putative [Eimeria tenella]|uniref:Oocyst wall protein COWP, putative n=1 Tax=Eimeria tenella TaxID=5802 RepID=U6L2Q1_EIMTE|nr:oocyst wall protein COWP, putative [Eimeria tenella]CDJ43463.1 oocyst wall protein COWP, putative [Eimeria tenella]|eukprot:XP_013234213.1 oocyst wall protein COWP, putative [Eimeria tenella]